ncbi:MAG: diheme cytochrome c [Oceanospirillaceae bacterium]|nr:diheme cytochrome c [Oceanospirillaceae bacterium]
MNRWLNGIRWTLGVLTIGGALSLGGLGLAGLFAGNGAWADDDRDEHQGRSGENAIGYRPDPLYSEECAACHLAYPAQMLPARSWQAIMAGLDNHFGENAALMPDTAQQISDYLNAHAADTGSRYMRAVASGDTPLRITGLPWFRGKHDEVPDRLVGQDAQVQSFGQCQACHGSAAERGIFDEDTVDIPGFGRWDD